jgi:hypothetical protein
MRSLSRIEKVWNIRFHTEKEKPRASTETPDMCIKKLSWKYVL